MKSWPVVVAGALLVASCGAPEPRPRSVQEFVEDPALLQGVVMRCADRRSREQRDAECANAFAAAERLAKDEDERRAADRAAEFERRREQRRVLEERQRAEAERAAPKFDPYNSPVLADPEPGTPAGTGPAGTGPAAGTSSNVATIAPP